MRGHTDSILCWTTASAGLIHLILKAAVRLYNHQQGGEEAADSLATKWSPWYPRCGRESRSVAPRLISTKRFGMGGDAPPASTGTRCTQ